MKQGSNRLLDSKYPVNKTHHTKKPPTGLKECLLSLLNMNRHPRTKRDFRETCATTGKKGGKKEGGEEETNYKNNMVYNHWAKISVSGKGRLSDDTSVPKLEHTCSYSNTPLGPRVSDSVGLCEDQVFVFLTSPQCCWCCWPENHTQSHGVCREHFEGKERWTLKDLVGIKSH